MTADEFSQQLPTLTNNPLPIKPPFVFNGMSARIFPLRASLDSLQQLCDGYLNFVPEEAGRFRAMAPYVLLMVLDYGQVAESVARIGWFAQLEVFFSIPVEWYKRVKGQWTFHDWALITPYIFVNDSFSVPLGRTVYGFNKILAELPCPPDNWIHNAMAPVTLAQVATAVFPEAYEGKKLETKVFLEIERDAPMVNFRIPPDPASPMMPWVMASNLARAAGGFARDLTWLAQAMRIFPINPGANPAFVPQMLAHLAPVFAPGGKGFIQNSLNLKQFRGAEDPQKICYQALTNGQMLMTGFNEGGLLGEERTFLGDLSGGHTIRLYDHSSLPIARTLGLDIDRQWDDQNGTVAEMKPLMPFWLSVNLLYDKGTNLAWRARDGVWKDAAGAPLVPGQAPVKAEDSPEFNCSVTTAVEAVTGPFEFSDTTIRVLPLLARRDALEGFIDSFINQPLQHPAPMVDGKRQEVRLSLWRRPETFVDRGPKPIGGDLGYVYLTASSFGDVTSKTNNVGDWAKYELSFLIPVKWERRAADGSWQTEGVGLLPAFTFLDDCIATISRFEVQGIDADTALFVRPESVWLKEGAADLTSKQTLLRVDAEIWPAFGAGQKATMQKVIEISHSDPNAGLGDAQSHDIPYLWAETQRVELGTKKGAKARFPKDFKIARALALELLGDQTPFYLYTLKQFRDVNDPDKACYQQFLRVPRVLKEIFDVREIEETLVVHLYDYPSLKIAQTLGIVAPTVQEGGAGIVYSAQAIRPFYIHATMLEPLAEPLLERAGTPEWNVSPGAFQSILSDAPDSPPIVVDLEAEAAQNQLDSCRMTYIMFQARERLRHGTGPAKPQDRIDKAAARRALELIDPQMVVESVLSREWGNLCPDARWRRGRRELSQIFAALPSGGSLEPYVELRMYELMNDRMALRPGSVASRLKIFEDDAKTPRAQGSRLDSWIQAVAHMLNSQTRFSERQRALERAYNAVAPWLMLGPGPFEEVCTEAYGNTPTVEDRRKAATELINVMKDISHLTVQGEPTDGPVASDQTRLREVLPIVEKKLLGSSDPNTESTGIRTQFVLDAVEMARAYCRAQREALLNKLSRAYQKPEFCIRRDSVGSRADSLLEAALSWDENWYYGMEIEPKDVPPASQGTPPAVADYPGECQIGPRLL